MLPDNGTNFVEANEELCGLITQMTKDTIVNESLVKQGVKWTFNPQYASHFGGVLETMIKAAKRAIIAILGNADVTDEELMTAFTGAESLINSRPLTYQSANPDDITPSTPNHFLQGQISGMFAPAVDQETCCNPKKCCRRIQELSRHFWHRWMTEWIPSLSTRKKWLHEGKNLQVNDVVLLVSPNNCRARGGSRMGHLGQMPPLPSET